jgi:DUF177 domain-containing protein
MSLKIRVTDISNDGMHLSAIEPVAAFATLLQVQQNHDCVFVAPLSIELQVAREYDHIRVAGSVETQAGLTCSRCLLDFTTKLRSDFTMFYLKSDAVSRGEEVELSEEDLIAVTFDGEEIDFTEQIAEQVLLELPFKPLCDEACLGLCSSCGVNLNQKGCNCLEQEINLKFNALKDFKAKQ